MLIVFARAPEPGRVKTRLAPLLGAGGAAALHAWLVERSLRTALRARCARVELHGTPQAHHPFFLACARRYGVRLRAQGAGDLGARMHRALERALASAPCAVLIGSDCPSLRPEDLRAAVRALQGGEQAVCTPAEDGGYALIGLRRSARGLFAGVPWGSASVFAATRRRLARLGWSWRSLPTVWDVDRPEDYDRLKRAGGLLG